tara:strand:- start:133357 stop:135855 length:2499 start_codon:yes stop_codon:yes gene_type:complete
VDLNYIGSLILILSAATVCLVFILSLVGFPLRSRRNAVRLVSLELTTPRRTYSSFYRGILGAWEFLGSGLLKWTGIRSRAMALNLAARGIYANLALVSLALFILIVLLVSGDLSNRYVVHNSSPSLGVFYRITGVWAGSSGSLLFWYFLLCLFSAIAVYQTRNRLYNRLPPLYWILASVQLLFIMLAVFFRDAQPFRTFAVEMAAGQGINPLLLHWAMIIHPPILYVGYVAFAIPFAITGAALLSGNLREDWLPLLRRWALFCWFFLGFGILLGSKWAYEELGWGGYWAWDPVENSSLMPFLFATAFLHSLIVQERRKMLRFWNVFLIITTYHFCLLGTWITRSGVLEGPHTFAESTIGTPMIVFISVSYLYFMRFLYFQHKKLRPENRLEAVTSKEGSMLLNNFLMTFSVFIILIGVFSPLMPLDCRWDGGLSCAKVEWKLSTFNKIMVPVGIITLFLMGASPLLAWRKSADAIYTRTLRIPIIAGIIASVAFGLTYGLLFTRPEGADRSTWGPGWVAELFTVLTVGIAAFTIVGLLQEYYRGVKSRMVRFEENALLAFVRLILRNKRRYAGYLVHISVVFLFIGYAGGSFKKTDKFQFHYYKMQAEPGSDYIHYYSGDRAYMENYTIEARDLFIRPEIAPHGDASNPLDVAISQEAHYRINPPNYQPPRPTDGTDPYEAANKKPSAPDRMVKFLIGFIPDGRMTTERHFHPRIYPPTGEISRSQDGFSLRTPTSEPDIKSTWSEDLYIQLGAISDASTGQNPDLTQMYELYFFDMRKAPEAYQRMFPGTIVANLEIWINPLVKFIWLGTVLFFLSGLILILPFGEKRKEG